MRVAIAGAGDLARYVVEELLAASHEVILISRSEKEWVKKLDVEFKTSDYTVSDLVKHLQGCEALVSCVLDYTMNSATVHLALLEACKQSETCKRYIPSEYAGNLDDHPNEPAFYAPNHNPVREALREQDQVMYTLFQLGWLADYFLPPTSRYIKDIGDFHPVNLSNRTITIPGTGKEPIAFTAARDGAKAIARLMDCDHWEPITYICGEITTWEDVAGLLERRGLGMRKTYWSVEDIRKQEAEAKTEDDVIAAQYAIWSTSGAGSLPVEKVEQQKRSHFNGLHLRTIEQLLDDAERQPNHAV